MPTTTTVDKPKRPRNRVMGYRLLVEPLENKSLATSWLWVPEQLREKVQHCRIVQKGIFRVTKKRPAMEVSVGQEILVDLEWNSQVVQDGDRTLKIISYRDAIAILD